MRRGRSGLVLGLLLWGRPALGLEPPPRVELELTREPSAESCLERPAIERAVERRLRRPVFERSGTHDLRISVALSRADSGDWSAKLVLSTRSGVELGARELQTSAKHCSALDEALVLVVALLVDSPEARERAHEAPPAEDVPAAPPAAPTRPQTRPPPRPPTPLELPPETFAPREPVRVELVAAAAAELGSLPALALGGGLGLRVRPPHFVDLGLKLAFFPAQETHSPSADRGGRFALALAAFEVCPLEHESGRLRVAGCVEQRVGRFVAAGFGYRQSSRTSELYYSLGAGVEGSFWIAPPFGLWLALGAEAPLARNAYVSLGPAGERREIFRPGAVAATSTLGVVFSLR